MAALSRAVEVLCNASNHDFSELGKEVEPAQLNKVIRRLRALAKGQQTPNSIQLVNTLKRKSKRIKELFSQKPVEALGKLPGDDYDYRVVDILMVEGDKGSTGILRRVLAQRSLAKHYNEYNPEKLRKMTKNKDIAIPRTRGSSIISFVQKYYPSRNLATTAVGVQVGLKMMAIQDLDGCDLSMLVVLAFANNVMRTITWEDVGKAFAPGDLNELCDLAESKSDWVSAAADEYDAQKPQKIRHPSASVATEHVDNTTESMERESMERPSKKLKASREHLRDVEVASTSSHDCGSHCTHSFASGIDSTPGSSSSPFPSEQEAFAHDPAGATPQQVPSDLALAHPLNIQVLQSNTSGSYSLGSPNGHESGSGTAILPLPRARTQGPTSKERTQTVSRSVIDQAQLIEGSPGGILPSESNNDNQWSPPAPLVSGTFQTDNQTIHSNLVCAPDTVNSADEDTIMDMERLFDFETSTHVGFS